MDAARISHERAMDEAAGVVSPWYLDAADLLAQPDPGPTPWLVDGLIVDQALVAIVGRWKTTKSYGVLDLCVAIATGRKAFGALAVPEPGPVVFVNEESGRAALWRRLDALCRGRGIDREEFRGRLLVAPSAGVKLDDEEWQSLLLDLGRGIRPRLFVFDPLARMKAPGRNESAQNEMAIALEFMRRLRDESGAAVAFVHHTGHEGQHMRGSSDLESVWETRLHWKREGQASVVTVHSEHREAEASFPIEYQIAWDGLTRSMRFELVRDPFEEWAQGYLDEYPDASGNDVYRAAEGRDDRPHKSKVHDLVKRLRAAGSDVWNHPGTTPSAEPGSGDGVSALRSRAEPPRPNRESEPVPKSGTTWPETSRCSICNTEKPARVAAGVTYFQCGHLEVVA